MYPDNSDPNNQWWQGTDFGAAEDVEVTPSISQHTTIYTNGFDPAAAAELERGSEVEIANIIFHRTYQKYGYLVYAEGNFWKFNKTQWEAIPDSSMEKAVQAFDGAVIGKGVLKLKASAIKGVISILRAKCAAPDFFEGIALGLNCRNGVVKIAEDGKATLHPHDPEDRHRFTIDADYDVSLKSVPTTSYVFKLLDGVFKDAPDSAQKIKLVAEILGAAAYGLATRLKQPKGFIFFGETANNGKSTVASLIELLLPRGSVSHIPLSVFNDEKRIINLAGKAANIVEELSGRALQGDIYKAAVTGEPIEGRQLHSPAATFRPRAIHIATTNILPAFEGGIDRGLQRRLFVVNFDRVIPQDEVIQDISDRIRREEMHLLVWIAVKGATRLIQQQAYTTPSSTVTAMSEWLLKDSVNAWFSEKYIITGNAQRYLNKDLYANFHAWCESEKIRPSSIPGADRFGNSLVRMAGVKRVRSQGKVYYFGFEPNPELF